MNEAVAIAFLPLQARRAAANAVVGLLVEDREIIVVTATGHWQNGGSPGVAKEPVFDDDVDSEFEYARRLAAAIVVMEASAVIDGLAGIGWSADELERTLAALLRPRDPDALLKLAHAAAEGIVDAEVPLIDRLADALSVRPTLTGEEVDAIVGEDARRTRWRHRPTIEAIVQFSFSENVS